MQAVKTLKRDLPSYVPPSENDFYEFGRNAVNTLWSIYYLGWPGHSPPVIDEKKLHFVAG